MRLARPPAGLLLCVRARLRACVRVRACMCVSVGRCVKDRDRGGGLGMPCLPVSALRGVLRSRDVGFGI